MQPVKRELNSFVNWAYIHNILFTIFLYNLKSNKKLTLCLRFSLKIILLYSFLLYGSHLHSSLPHHLLENFSPMFSHAWSVDNDCLCSHHDFSQSSYNNWCDILSMRGMDSMKMLFVRVYNLAAVDRAVLIGGYKNNFINIKVHCKYIFSYVLSSWLCFYTLPLH